VATTKRYPEELRERAVRRVFDHRKEYPSAWAAIRSLAEKSRGGSHGATWYAFAISSDACGVGGVVV
jgi:hypothetical protein